MTPLRYTTAWLLTLCIAAPLRTLCGVVEKAVEWLDPEKTLPEEK
jgi:hypothetical protein